MNTGCFLGADRGWFHGDDSWCFCRGARDEGGAECTEDCSSCEDEEGVGWSEAGADDQATDCWSEDAAQATETCTPCNTCGAACGAEVVGGQAVGEDLGSQDADASQGDCSVHEWPG